MRGLRQAHLERELERVDDAVITVIITTVEPPAAGTKRPHKITDSSGTVYKTFDPAIAHYLSERLQQTVQLEVETKPGKPGYGDDIFITKATAAGALPSASAAAAPPAPGAAARELPHIAARTAALQCATALAEGRIIGAANLIAAADLFAAWILERPITTALVPLQSAADATIDATIGKKPVGRAVPLELLSKIVNAGKLAPEPRRLAFYGEWLPAHGYAIYSDFQMFGAEHAQAALDYLAGRE